MCISDYTCRIDFCTSRFCVAWVLKGDLAEWPETLLIVSERHKDVQSQNRRSFWGCNCKAWANQNWEAIFLLGSVVLALQKTRHWGRSPFTWENVLPTSFSLFFTCFKIWKFPAVSQGSRSWGWRVYSVEMLVRNPVLSTWAPRKQKGKSSCKADENWSSHY